LQAVHRTTDYDGGSRGPRRDGRSTGPFVALHPLVRIHPETGEKLLFLNPGTISHIVGLKEPESKALLDLLFYEATRPEYQVRFHWRPKSLVVWDNQAVAHAGPIDYAQFDLPRAVRRITVAGELPAGPTASSRGSSRASCSTCSADARRRPIQALGLYRSGRVRRGHARPAGAVRAEPPGQGSGWAGAVGGPADRVPKGTILTVGDPVTEWVVQHNGWDKGLPFTIKWVQITGGPDVTEAFHAKALDVGLGANVPPIHATWVGLPVKIIAAAYRRDPLTIPPLCWASRPRPISVDRRPARQADRDQPEPGAGADRAPDAACRRADQADVTLVELPSSIGGDVYTSALASNAVDMAPIGGGIVAERYLRKYGATARRC
jgi:hypothetical protein